jgi:UDP-N-acetylmuramyl tripeptide synthase
MNSTPPTFHTVEAAVAWLRARQAESLTLDSRTVKAGDAWLAWPGAHQDPREFVPQALQNGACACLLEAEGFSLELGEADSNAVALMADLKTHAGEIASQFWGQPSHQLRMVAVTGTNGNTRCEWWIAQALAVGRG